MMDALDIVIELMTQHKQLGLKTQIQRLESRMLDSLLRLIVAFRKMIDDCYLAESAVVGGMQRFGNTDFV